MNSVIQDICTFFELGTISSCDNAGGYANENFKVATEQGHYLIKVIHEHNVSEVDLEQRYVHYIYTNSFPLVPYLANSTGSSLYNKNDFLATAQKWFASEDKVDHETVKNSIASTLAELHNLPIPNLAIRKSWLRPSFIPDSLRKISIPKGDQNKIDMLSRTYQDNQFDYTQLPTSILHGDVHEGNVLLSRSNTIVLIDWEETTQGPAVLDLAMFLVNSCFKEEKFDSNQKNHLVNVYNSRRQLTKSELDCLDNAMTIALTIETLWLYQREQGISSSQKKFELFFNRLKQFTTLQNT